MGLLVDILNGLFNRKPRPLPKPNPNPPIPDETQDSVLLKLHNDRRGVLCQLVINPQLTAAAQKHAQWMADSNVMSHNEGRSSVADRVKAVGYSWSYVGENIAQGYPTPDIVFQNWMNSPGHRANILNRNYKDVGFGIAKDVNGTIFWCADLGRQGA